MNASVSFTHIIDDKEEAMEAGRRDQALFTAYMDGYSENAES